jgi:hypothetical protein
MCDGWCAEREGQRERKESINVRLKKREQERRLDD